MGWQGKMEEESSRCVRWKRCLGLVSADPSAWAEDAQLRRQYYSDIRDAYAGAQLPAVSAVRGGYTCIGAERG